MVSKTTLIQTFSLCVLAGLAATLITSAQTSDIPVTQGAARAQNVMPVARTLTSADGRTIDVTIISKTDTAIQATRADGKAFEIALDKLSDADKAFVAGLVDGPGKAAPGKKASVLYAIAWNNPADYEKNHKERVAWLKTNGFDVTIRISHYFNTKLPQIADEEVSWLTPLAMMDSYDIVWIQDFEKSRIGPASKIKEYDFYQLANHRNNQGGIMIIRTGEDDKKIFLGTDNKVNFRNKNYVSNDGVWVFFLDYDSSKDTKGQKEPAKPSADTINLKLLQEIEALLAGKKK